MPSRKNPQAKSTQGAVATVEPKAKAKSKSDLKQQVNAVLEQAREKSRENMLAGLGMIARMRQQREERRAELVEAGKRFEPEVKQAIEGLKAKLQPGDGMKAKFDTSKFKLKVQTKDFDREAMKSRLQERMAEAMHRMGLPTRKEVDELARKVDKLAELQRA